MKDRVNDKVVISVIDNGIGLGDAKSHQAFGMFKRLSNDKPGVGLGLTIAKRIVQSHGGRIWFDPDQEKTTFYIELPDPPKPERTKRSKASKR